MINAGSLGCRRYASAFCEAAREDKTDHTYKGHDGKVRGALESFDAYGHQQI